MLRRAYPELNLQKINVITQYDGNIGLESKNFRLDVWAQDDKGRIYDIEMQTTNKHDLEERMQYYAAGLNNFTLKSGQPYTKFKSTYVVFFCTYDPFDQGKSMYEFNFFDHKTKTIEFNAGMHIKVFNSKGNNRDLNQKMLDFLDYMNSVINHAQGYIADLQKDIDHYVNSGKWVDDMDKLAYEMNQVAMKAAERATKKKAIEDAITLIQALKQVDLSSEVIFEKSIARLQ
ncbi:Rpn family recombination-promoting nuclease/putative transposase [Lactobacillus gallinarum]|uniref:Rpn family recombination-promoting nuclease/putative transposase n=1 Tax=Lactobacillus gallinarum TaxID=52242 RepID=UPI0024B18971|nr:Rpn family recombination-promoting nuclease/putative transposase [Lactobacillus gallinarum]